MSRFVRLRLVDPQTVLSHVDAEGEDAERVQTAPTADRLVESFIEADSWTCLGKTLLFMLPQREAVWASCLWARACEQSGAVEASRALRAAEAWVRDQAEDVRYRAFELANEENLATPGAWAALAAFWSGPSISQPEFDAVPPGPELASVAGASVYTIALMAMAQTGHTAKDLTDLALEVAAGGSGLDLLAERFAAPSAGAGAQGRDP